jgi:hypothetical protein
MKKLIGWKTSVAVAAVGISMPVIDPRADSSESYPFPASYYFDGNETRPALAPCELPGWDNGVQRRTGYSLAVYYPNKRVQPYGVVEGDDTSIVLSKLRMDNTPDRRISAPIALGDGVCSQGACAWVFQLPQSPISTQGPERVSFVREVNPATEQVSQYQIDPTNQKKMCRSLASKPQLVLHCSRDGTEYYITRSDGDGSYSLYFYDFTGNWDWMGGRRSKYNSYVAYEFGSPKYFSVRFVLPDFLNFPVIPAVHIESKRREGTAWEPKGRCEAFTVTGVDRPLRKRP